MSRIRAAQLGAVILVAGAAVLVIANVSSRGPVTSNVRTPAVDTSPSAPVAEDKTHELKALEVELGKKPKHVPILLRMAQIDLEMGKPADAIPRLRQILEVEPKNVDAHLELGRALYATNDVSDAISETNRVLAVDAKQVDALYNLGAIYANLGRTDLARQYWNRAVEAAPDSDSGRRSRDGVRKLGSAN